MKKVLNISLAGRSFAIEEDAYKRLSEYLGHFRTRLAASATGENAEVMEDLESRISELFMQELGDESRVVSLSLVERVTGQLGMPDGGYYQIEFRLNLKDPRKDSAEMFLQAPPLKF